MDDIIIDVLSALLTEGESTVLKEAIKTLKVQKKKVAIMPSFKCDKEH